MGSSCLEFTLIKVISWYALLSNSFVNLYKAASITDQVALTNYIYVKWLLVYLSGNLANMLETPVCKFMLNPQGNICDEVQYL